MIASALSAYDEQQQQQGLPYNELLLEECCPTNNRHSSSLSTSRKNKNNNKQTVSFAATAKVRKTIHISEYTEMERHNTWYNREELKSIHTENRCIIDLVMMGETIVEDNESDTHQISLRGLESFTSSELRSKKQYNRAVALDAVLNEQYYQQSNNMTPPDVEQIAIEYSTVTYECQVTANMIGISDEIAVMSYTGRRASIATKKKQQQRTPMSSRLLLHCHHGAPSPSRVAIFRNIPYPRSL